MERFRGPVCGVDNCTATRYYTEDGLTYCQEGHQRAGTQIKEGDDEFGQHRLKTKKKKEVHEKVSRIYRGKAGFELYLQCYQLILWKQCHALVHVHGVLPQLESVIRDLWSLRLQLLKEKSVGDSDEDAAPVVFSSQLGPDALNDSNHAKGVGTKAENVAPQLIDSLALCYLGMILLRIPASLGDLHRLATSGRMPYFRAINHIPLTMKSRLPAQYFGALELKSTLEPDDIHLAVQKLAHLYSRFFGLSIPSLNYHSLLVKRLLQLSIPLRIFDSISQISTLLSHDFTILKPRFRNEFLPLPEVQLMSILIVAVKMYHPFDSVKRYAKSVIEHGYLTMDWDIWSNAYRDFEGYLNNQKALAFERHLKTSESDVIGMSTEQIDSYLDWYEETWTGQDEESRESRRLPQALLNMFPVKRGGEASPGESPLEKDVSDQSAEESRLKAVLKALKMKGILSEESEAGQKKPVLRVGARYKRYRTTEALPPNARFFYETVASLTGISLVTLVKAVNRIEYRLLYRRREQLRAASGESDADNNENEEEEDSTDEMEYPSVSENEFSPGEEKEMSEDGDGNSEEDSI